MGKHLCVQTVLGNRGWDVLGSTIAPQLLLLHLTRE